VQQRHRIADVINKASENQQYCTAAFWDVSQAFDNVWHQGLVFKIKSILPSSYFNLLKSYLNESQFRNKIQWRNFQVASTSIQPYSKGEFLVLIYMYYTNLTYQHPG
jgi:uncharacterized protein YllA (UPF0747 family)